MIMVGLSVRPGVQRLPSLDRLAVNKDVEVIQMNNGVEQHVSGDCIVAHESLS